MNGIKKISFTSDWHIGHANAIKFDKRPFEDLKHMNRVLINNFNSSVPPDGITYFLGDIGTSSMEETKEVITKLNGIKILILGNHDRGINSMYNAGFDVVMNSATLIIANEIVTLSHCPLPGLFREDTSGMRNMTPGEMWHGEQREAFKQYMVPNNGQFHLHGHIHSPNGGRSEKTLKRQYDIGVVANNFRPVSMSTIESWISLYKTRGT
jgi:calcineurin-like phosphoesterase family protein